MDTVVLLAVLVAAVCHALWNALIKSSGDAFVRMTIVGIVGGVFGVVLLLITGMPGVESLRYAMLSVVVHQAYFVCLLFGYRYGDLSDVYPVARGSAPLLVALGAFVFAGEGLDFAKMLAVGVICLGILSLGLQRDWQREDKLALLFALLTGLTIAAYTVIDGLGGRASGNVVGYIGVLFAVDALPFLAVLMIKRRSRVIASIMPQLKYGVVGGVLATTAYGIVIWAMSTTHFALVSALRETSVVLAAYIGTRIMGEPFGQRRIAGAVAVVVGVIWLHLA